MSSAQYMQELTSRSSLGQSASKNYKQNLQPPQTTGKGLKNHWICVSAAQSLSVPLLNTKVWSTPFTHWHKWTVGSVTYKLWECTYFRKIPREHWL